VADPLAEQDAEDLDPLSRAVAEEVDPLTRAVMAATTSSSVANHVC
jgi:hypothetical protein